MSRFAIVASVLLVACTDDKVDSGDTAPALTWTSVASGHPSAFLSVWGSSPSDVWIVGADAGSGPAVEHYDGAAWTAIDTGSTGDLWWVTGTSTDTRWFAGAAGRVLRYGITAGSVDESVLDPDMTVFGAWGAADDDVWAVGGNINVPADGAAIYHWDGVTWTRAELPADAAAGVAVYKVWGRAANDVYAVGTGGMGLHWDGAAWASISTGSTRNLFTVSGNATEEWAVGGEFSGTIVHGSGGVWTDETPDMAPQLNGVYAGGDYPVAVGTSGAVYTRESGAWEPDARGAVTPYDLHGVWLDSDGGIWAVGGKLSSYPLDNGVIGYGGPAAVPAL